MASPNLLFPTTYTIAPFGGPKAQGAHLPTVPRITSAKGVPPTAASYAYSRGIAEQSASKAGIDPQQFVRQMSYISGLNPTARSQGWGIAGLGSGGSSKVNPWDQQQSMDYAAKLMAGLSLLRSKVAPPR